jgi:hypothetical protein
MEQDANQTLSHPSYPDGRQWAWNSSTLRPAKECKRKYYYEVILGYKSTGENQNIIFGGHYAKALEHFHGLRSRQSRVRPSPSRGGRKNSSKRPSLGNLITRRRTVIISSAA